MSNPNVDGKIIIEMAFSKAFNLIAQHGTYEIRQRNRDELKSFCGPNLKAE